MAEITEPEGSDSETPSPGESNETVAPEPADAPPEADSAVASSHRYFVPSNREAVLRLLSGLVIPRQGVAPRSIAPLGHPGVAVLEGGLRSSETSTVCAGQERRFPVLVELKQSQPVPMVSSPGVEDILGLCFRTEGERDDFLFRPVAEWNPDGIRCSVEAELFDQPGDSRVQALELKAQECGAWAADRVTGGIAALLLLGEARSDCLPEMAAIFGCYGGEDESLLVDLIPNSLAWLQSTASPERSSRQKATVVRAFGRREREAGRALILKLSQALEAEPAEESMHKRERQWHECALDVWDNKQDLDGRILSDNGALFLRAALLASKVDSVSALASFSSTDPPAGICVSCIAAFLLGLKTGLARMEWQHKSKNKAFLSTVHAHLLDLAPEEWKVGLDFAFQLEPHGDGHRGTLSWQGGVLVQTQIRKTLPPEDADKKAEPATKVPLPPPPPPPPTPEPSLEEEVLLPPVSPALWEQFVALGCSQVSGQEIQLPGGSRVTVEVHDDYPHVPTLVKELPAGAGEDGLLELNAGLVNLWRFALRKGAPLLMVDLLDSPSAGSLRLMEDRLNAAEEEYGKLQSAVREAATQFR